jgi:hypothetical protein
MATPHELQTLNERGLRDAVTPRIETEDELLAVVRALVERDHDYGTCVYAMSIAAEAAYRYVAGRLSVTGFQASCADMDFLRRIRHMPGPFTVIDVSNALYPQYDLVGRLREYIQESSGWLRDEARKRLDNDSAHASPNVIAHWKRLAGEEA